MYLKYGSYAHATGECQISINKQTEFNEAKEPWAIRERWDIQGLVTNATGNLASMKTSVDALVSAYSVHGYDLVLYTPSNTATSHALYSDDCIGGTVVVQPVSFPSGEGAEGITYRNYTVSVEGLVRTSSGHLLSFTESLSFSGGGPVYGHIQTLRGLPVKQLLRQNSVFRATQQGSAVGISTYPIIPSPVWPSAQIGTGQEERGSPKRFNYNYSEYPISWRYEFESAYPLLGNPTRWTSTRR